MASVIGRDMKTVRRSVELTEGKAVADFPAVLREEIEAAMVDVIEYAALHFLQESRGERLRRRLRNYLRRLNGKEPLDAWFVEEARSFKAQVKARAAKTLSQGR